MRQVGVGHAGRRRTAALSAAVSATSLPFSTAAAARGPTAAHATATSLDRHPLHCLPSHRFCTARGLFPSSVCLLSGRVVGGSSLLHVRRCFSSVSAQELRQAMRTLGLADSCTDAEVKAAFQTYAKANHPDTFGNYQRDDSEVGAGKQGNSSSNNNADYTSPIFREKFSRDEAERKSREAEELRRLDPRAAAAERMVAGTEAYQLLRKLTFRERQLILRHGVGNVNTSGKARRNFYTYDDFGPGGAGRGGFQFTEEEYAKAQSAYAGRPRRGMRDHTDHHQGRQHHHSGSTEDDFFDPRTAEGRKRTAAFNKVTSRIEQLRRRAGRHAAPWKVGDGDGTYHNGAPPGGGEAKTDSHNTEEFLRNVRREAYRRNNTFRTFQDRFSYGPGFSLRYYLSQIKDDLRQLRRKYEKDKTFAGIHGGRYDSPEQEAKVKEELKNFPQLRQYLLLKQRAQEKAVVDQAVGRLLYLMLSAVSLTLFVLVVVSITRKRRAVSEYERLKAQREAEGGG